MEKFYKNNARHSTIHKNITCSQYGIVKPWQFYQITQASRYLMQRLKRWMVLDGHTGCVNTISWNSSGYLLLTGSDDYHLNIYDVFSNKLLHSIQSGHRANIFSAKFLPCTSDMKIVSCSGDGMLHYNELGSDYGSNYFNCHSGTAYEVLSETFVAFHRKRVLSKDNNIRNCNVSVLRYHTFPVLVTPGDPNTFLSCGEDGTIRMFDLRAKNKCYCQDCNDDILIDCRHAITSISCNPLLPYHLAAGCKDSFVRVFDRRMLGTSLQTRSVNRNRGWMPGLFCKFKPEKLKKDMSCRVTSLNYSNDGKDLLVSYCTDYVYTFSVKDECGKVMEMSTEKHKQKSQNGSRTNGHLSDTSDEDTPVAVKRLRLRGDWADTGPQARPEDEQENFPENNLMQRMSVLFTRWLEDAMHRGIRTASTSSDSSQQSQDQDLDFGTSVLETSDGHSNSQQTTDVDLNSETSRRNSNQLDQITSSLENDAVQQEGVSCVDTRVTAEQYSSHPCESNNGQTASLHDDDVESQEGRRDSMQTDSCDENWMYNDIDNNDSEDMMSHDNDVSFDQFESVDNQQNNSTVPNDDEPAIAEITIVDGDIDVDHDKTNNPNEIDNFNSSDIQAPIQVAEGDVYELANDNPSRAHDSSQVSERDTNELENDYLSRANDSSQTTEIEINERTPLLSAQLNTRASSDNILHENIQQENNQVVGNEFQSYESNNHRTSSQVDNNDDDDHHHHHNHHNATSRPSYSHNNSSDLATEGSSSNYHVNRNKAATRIQNFLRSYKQGRQQMDEHPGKPEFVYLPTEKMVYKGHRNSKTMIKEANFWGEDFILSGSDCGRIFIWDRHTGDLVMLLQGDEHVVNCVQPHPYDPILATSGIDHDTKLWAPLSHELADLSDLPEIVSRNERMLEESRDTITVPASFVLRMLASFGSIRTRRSARHRARYEDLDTDDE